MKYFLKTRDYDHNWGYFIEVEELHWGGYVMITGRLRDAMLFDSHEEAFQFKQDFDHYDDFNIDWGVEGSIRGESE